ncbi:hypothetical protein LWI28_020398 [Acer negundo]|uniref:Uncharacterized protein n=1 Tax=Acer negundo TaxID=4023 RepID=A0AAD5J254_ACENE|nr:hypothetical protein LWI28_020398 [Acer negundo]
MREEDITDKVCFSEVVPVDSLMQVNIVADLRRSSEKHYGKRKSNSEENEEAYCRRKARRLDGISAIEDSICKDKSERISGGEVTNTLVSPIEDDALEAVESAGRSSLARRSQ